MTELTSGERQCWILTDEALFGDLLGNALSSRGLFDSVVTLHPSRLKPNLYSAEVEPEMLLLDSDSFDCDQSLRHAFEIAENYLPDTELVLFTNSESCSLIPAAIQNGVLGIGYKSHSVEDIDRIIEIVRGGNAFCCPGVAQATLCEIRRLAEQKTSQAKLDCHLTKREIEVLEYVAGPDRIGNKEIAKSLGLRVSTVKNHLHNIFEKLEVSSRQAAVRNAIAFGFLSCTKDKVFANPGLEING